MRSVVWAVVMVVAGAVGLGAQDPIAPGRTYQVGPGFVHASGYLGLIDKQLGGATPADDVYYRPEDGKLIVGITKHPQRSGYQGELLVPGDCWYQFDTFFPYADVSLVDVEGRGFHKITLHRKWDGQVMVIDLNIPHMPACDTSDAF